MLKKIFKKLTSLNFNLLHKKLRWSNYLPNTLFDGDDKLFKQVVTGARVYAEYGCGKSTYWVLNNTLLDVISVDTSADWVLKVLSKNKKNSKRLNIKHIDLGKVGDWGWPIDLNNHESLAHYTNFIWEQTNKPNVILIDGRFRVCCFLTCLKFGKEGTSIIFDDYTNRPNYHVVEKYVSRENHYGRQCLFVVPSKAKIDFEALEKDIDAYRLIMD